jgi:hypothetical protein
MTFGSQQSTGEERAMKLPAALLILELLWACDAHEQHEVSTFLLMRIDSSKSNVHQRVVKRLPIYDWTWNESSQVSTARFVTFLS